MSFLDAFCVNTLPWVLISLSHLHFLSVLVQSLENYQHLINHEQMSKYFPSTSEQATSEARFGENLVVSGLEQTAICIGDVFESASGVKLQVTSPRLPCAYIDKRNGKR